LKYFSSFGVSIKSSFLTLFNLYFLIILKASVIFVLSLTVGPEAIKLKSLPGTSEKIKEMTLAG
jgi:hypothetical protein